MSEYRTTATLTAEGTFVVPGPEGLPAGTRAEVTVRMEETPIPPVKQRKTLDEFYRRLEAQPLGASTWESEQAALRESREEWD